MLSGPTKQKLALLRGGVAAGPPLTGSYFADASGGNQYGAITDAAQDGALDVSGDFTYMHWFRFQSLPPAVGNRAHFLNKTVGADQRQYNAFFIQGTPDIVDIEVSQDGDLDPFRLWRWVWDAPSLLTWYHATIVFDASDPSDDQMKLYFDTSLQTLNSIPIDNGPVTSIHDGTADFQVPPPNHTEKGAQWRSDMRLYDKTMSQSEIADVWKTVPVGNEDGLIWYCRGDDGSGVTLIDSAGGNDINLFNTDANTWSALKPY